MNKIPRIYCKWCGLVHAHNCHTIQTFTVSGGRRFTEKKVIGAPEKPELRVASLLWKDGRRYPMLHDDMLELNTKDMCHHYRRLQRLGTYHDHNIEQNIWCWRLLPIPLPTDEDADFWDEIEARMIRARKMGARL